MHVFEVSFSSDQAPSVIGDCLVEPVAHDTITPRKVSPGRQFSGKKPPRLAAAWAGRISPLNYRPGPDFSGGDPIIGRLFMGPAIFQ